MTCSSRSTIESSTPIALRAKCAALCSFGTASSMVSSRHKRSITCSRCSRRPGVNANTLTESRGVAPSPVVRSYLAAVDCHGEPTEHVDHDCRHGLRASHRPAVTA